MRSPGWVTEGARFALAIVIVLACVAAVVWADCGHAQDCAPEVTLRRAEVVHQGNPGIWFDVRVARCMVGDLETLPLYRDRVRLLDEQLEIRSEQVDALREAVQAATEAGRRLDATLMQAESAAAQARAALHAWHRSPWLWFAIGAVSVIAIAVTTLLLVR